MCEKDYSSFLKRLKDSLLESDENINIEKLRRPEDPLSGIVWDIIKMLKSADIEKVKVQYNELLEKFSAEAKRTAQSNPSDYLQTLQEFISLFEPIVVDGAFNDQSTPGLLNPDKHKGFWSDKYLNLYDQMGKIYEVIAASCDIDLELEDLKLDLRLDLCIRLTQFVRDLAAIQNEPKLSVKQELELLFNFISYYENFLTIMAMELNPQNKKLKFGTPFGIILHKLAGGNKNFIKIHKNFFKIKQFRNKQAHHMLTQREGRLYWYDGKNHEIKREAVEDAIDYILILLYAFMDHWVLGTLRKKTKLVLPILGAAQTHNESILNCKNVSEEHWTYILDKIAAKFTSSPNQSKNLRYNHFLLELERSRKQGALPYSQRIIKHALDIVIEISFLRKTGIHSYSLADDCKENFKQYLREIENFCMAFIKP